MAEGGTAPDGSGAAEYGRAGKYALPFLYGYRFLLPWVRGNAGLSGVFRGASGAEFSSAPVGTFYGGFYAVFGDSIHLLLEKKENVFAKNLGKRFAHRNLPACGQFSAQKCTAFDF